MALVFSFNNPEHDALVERYLSMGYRYTYAHQHEDQLTPYLQAATCLLHKETDALVTIHPITGFVKHIPSLRQSEQKPVTDYQMAASTPRKKQFNG